MLTVVLLLCCIALAVLSVIIFYANYRESTNRWLSAFTFGGLLWLLANLLANLSSDPHTNLLFSRLTLLGASFVPLTYLFFCVSFTRKKLRRTTRIGLYVPAVLLLLSMPTKLNIESVDKVTLAIRPGIAYPLLLFVLVGYFSYGVILLLHDYAHSQLNRRRQLYYILLGTVLTLVPAIVLSVVMPLLGYPQAVTFAPVVSIFFSLFTAVAILRHRLFDIRLFVIRAAAYGLTVLLVSLFYLLPAIWLLARLMHVQLTAVRFLELAVASLALTVAYRYMRMLFDRLTKRVFYRYYYDPQDVLDKLGDLLAYTIDIGRLQEGSGQIITQALNISLLKYDLAKGAGNDSRLEQLFRRVPNSQNVIVIDEVADRRALAEEFRSKDIAAVVRLRTTHGALGYMTLGFKRSGELYTQKDQRLLSTAADEIALSMQNALHFEEIQNFNKTLQERVNKATTELRRTNEKLKLLDQTKDEFITMASHQLRTPLTSVKGYLSMVLEGDAGKISDNQRKLLEQSSASSQRMVYLISDLLNLSRLNTGKFVIEPTPVDLSEVVQAEVEQLVETAKARELTLVYNRPATFPQLLLDETKIHQVVMNFIDNAIYYTPAGGTVTVALRETPTAVEYLVRDTGIGVPKAVQHKLFTKFYRAANAQQARPDGTGLGLFMAKKVVVAQGGSIVFESEEGKGSTFGFRFSKAGHLVPSTPQPGLQPAAKQPVRT